MKVVMKVEHVDSLKILQCEPLPGELIVRLPHPNSGCHLLEPVNSNFDSRLLCFETVDAKL